MPGLLSIPLEIRDEIYGLVLVSPTGAVEPISWQDAYFKKLPGSMSSRRHFYLVTSHHASKPPYWSITPTRKEFISISLLRTNKQINQEATPHFYKKTTFYFTSPRDIESFLRKTTFYAPKHIRSVSFSIKRDELYLLDDLARIAKAFAKRTQKEITKKKALQRIELLLNYDDLTTITALPRMSEDTGSFRHCFFESVYASFARASATLSGVTKSMRLVGNDKHMEKTTREILDESTRMSAAVRDLSWAWGGSLHWGSEMLWEDVPV